MIDNLLEMWALHMIELQRAIPLFLRISHAGFYEQAILEAITEIIESFEIDEVFLVNLEREEIVCPTCTRKAQPKLFTATDMEKIRLAKILTERRWE